MLNLEQKKAIVAEVAEVASNAHSAIAAEYVGVTVEQMTTLRNAARTGGVHLQVVRNTLAKRALEGTDFECMSDGLSGQLVWAFSQEDPGAAARVIKDFAKDNDQLVVKMVSIGGKLLQPSDIAALASLPTYDQAVSLTMAVMLAPIEKFVRTLNEPHAQLVRCIAAVRDQKQAA